MVTLTMQITKEAFLPATEREEGRRRSYADIDPNVACVYFIPELTSGGAITGKNAGHITIAAVVAS